MKPTRERAIAALNAVILLHQQAYDNANVCAECGQHWPCKTRIEIEKELNQ